MRHLGIALALLIACSRQSPAQAIDATRSVDGLWDAIIVANEAEVPFRFEIESTAAGAQGFFFEGDRRIGSTSGKFVDGILRFEYEFLNTTLALRLEDNQLV